MSIALRKRLEREYGQGGTKRKRLAEKTEKKSIPAKRAREEKREEGGKAPRKPLGLIKSILESQPKPSVSKVLKRSKEPGIERDEQKETSKTLPAKQTAKSPTKKKEVAKTCVSFQALLGGVNAGSVVMRKRLENEYGKRPAHKRKMGYFSYMAEKQGANKAMEVMEETLEETEQKEVEKAKETAKKIVQELTRAKPDSNFLSRILQSTMRHNKRVLEQIEALEKKEEEDFAKEEDGRKVRIAGISELIRMYLNQNTSQEKGTIEGSDNQSINSKKSTPVSRMASALFGLSQGTVLQRRLQVKYGLGGNGEAEKKAKSLAEKKLNKEKPPAQRPKPARRPTQGRLFAALAGGILKKDRPAQAGKSS
ncbi:hypothetical protein AAMO2058_000295100 [Amorphochlora amoebiformis]